MKFPLPTWRNPLPQPQRLMWLAGALLAAVYWVVFAIQPASVTGVVVGSPSPVDVTAPRSVTFVSESLTKQTQEQAAANPALRVYTVDVYKVLMLKSQLAALLSEISDIRNQGGTWRSRMERIDALDAALDVDLVPRPIAQQLTDMSESDWVRLSGQILAIHDQAIRDVDNYLDAENIERLNTEIIPTYISVTTDPAVRELILRFIQPFLQTNVDIDVAKTAAAQDAARAQVSPVTIAVQQGESIVRVGDVVSLITYEKLQAVGALTTRSSWVEVIGQVLLAMVLSALWALTLWRGDRHIVTNLPQLLTVVVLIGVTTMLARLGSFVNPLLLTTAPIMMMAMLFTTLFGMRTSSLITANVAMVLLIIAGGSLIYALPPIVAAFVAIASMRQVNRSLVFVNAGIVAVIGSVLLAIGLFAFVEGSFVWEVMGPVVVATGAGAMVSALLALGLYNVVGRFAGVVTQFHLLEWAHPKQPLLRRLMREAPGTYYHSISVGNLAENAAEAIGADGLLLRVASYYHDIGKLKRPYFFTDNQSEGVNLHDTVTPSESATIIIDHVRDGVVMAQNAGLPTILIDFIRTHHGTSVVRYFYQKARDIDANVDVRDFTYPGPIPFTREQVIMMLADSVEATVRSKVQSGAVATKGNSNGVTIDELVGSIIQERIDTLQMVNAPITFDELTRIRKTFVSTLMGIYHTRVDYTPKKSSTSEPVVEAQGHI